MKPEQIREQSLLIFQKPTTRKLEELKVLLKSIKESNNGKRRFQQ